MPKRLYLRAGEVAVLFGEDSTRTEWQLWNDLTNGVDTEMSEYGRWQGRLSGPIMQGISEDHRLRIERQLEPSDQSTSCPIMPPKAWSVQPSMLTGGRPSILVIQQKTGQSLREWKEPQQIPPKHMRRFQAVAAAFGVEDVLVGILVDGYASRLFHVSASNVVRDEIATRACAFIKKVHDGDEPDVDFSADAAPIRQGIAIARTEAATETVDAILTERAQLLAKQAPLDTSLKQLDARLREIDNNLIHLAGSVGKLEVGARLVSITRDAKNKPKVTVVDRAAAPLF